jgi:hypothetical protein
LPESWIFIVSKALFLGNNFDIIDYSIAKPAKSGQKDRPEARLDADPVEHNRRIHHNLHAAQADES